MIEGWTVIDIAQEDGGRLVRLSRKTRGVRIQYSATFWRGNGGALRSTLVERSDCTAGETLPRGAEPDSATVRSHLAAHLAVYTAAARRGADVAADRAVHVGNSAQRCRTLYKSSGAGARNAGESASRPIGDDRR